MVGGSYAVCIELVCHEGVSTYFHNHVPVVSGAYGVQCDQGHPKMSEVGFIM